MRHSSNSFWSTFELAFLHWFLGTGASLILGFLPEAHLSRYYYNTGIEAFVPAIATVGLVLGIAVGGRIKGGMGANWAWVFGMLWLFLGVYGFKSDWNAGWSRQPNAWSYVFANMFGPTSACSGSECLGELIFTAPFVASITYSLGAVVRRTLFAASTAPTR